MATRIERCKNACCGRLYLVEQFSRAFGRRSQVGIIHCPYCWHGTEADPSKAFRTAEIPRDLEEWDFRLY